MSRAGMPDAFLRLTPTKRFEIIEFLTKSSRFPEGGDEAMDQFLLSLAVRLRARRRAC